MQLKKKTDNDNHKYFCIKKNNLQILNFLFRISSKNIRNTKWNGNGTVCLQKLKEKDRSIALLVLTNMIVSYIVIIEFVNTFHIVIHMASFFNVTRYVSLFNQTNIVNDNYLMIYLYFLSLPLICLTFLSTSFTYKL